MCFPKFNPREISEILKAEGRGASKWEYLLEAMYLSRRLCLSVSVLRAGSVLYKQVHAASGKGQRSLGQMHLRLMPHVVLNAIRHCSWCLRMHSSQAPDCQGALRWMGQGVLRWPSPQLAVRARGSPRPVCSALGVSPVLVLMFSVPTVCPIRWYWFSLEPSSATTTDLVVPLVQT